MKKYFLHINGSTMGPYSFNELLVMNLSPSTPVWFEGLGNWRNANQIPELASLFVSNPQSYNPQSYNQQPYNYNQPASRSTPFSQVNYAEMGAVPQKKSSGKLWFIIGGGVLVLVIGIIFLVYRVAEKKREMRYEMDVLMDSMQHADEAERERNLLIADSTRMADSMIVEEQIAATSSVDNFTGSFDNFNGGTVDVSGSDVNNLYIKIKFVSTTDVDCNVSLSGEGALIGTDKVEMKTSDGCKIILSYTGASIISLEESSDCQGDHGKNCLFSGVYLKK